jgi:uncharacterized protein (TIGR00251 family)
MARLSVKIIPNASRTEIAGREGRAWKIRLAAPPVEGKANDALIEFLSDVLDVPKSSISIIQGHSSKHKILDVPGNISDMDSRMK